MCHRADTRAVRRFSLQNKRKLFRAPQQMMLGVGCVTQHLALQITYRMCKHTCTHHTQTPAHRAQGGCSLSLSRSEVFCRGSGVSSEHMRAVTGIHTKSRRSSLQPEASASTDCTDSRKENQTQRPGQKAAEANQAGVEMGAASARGCLQLLHWRSAPAQS